MHNLNPINIATIALEHVRILATEFQRNQIILQSNPSEEEVEFGRHIWPSYEYGLNPLEMLSSENPLLPLNASVPLPLPLFNAMLLPPLRRSHVLISMKNLERLKAR